jgi:hypothetical protein
MSTPACNANEKSKKLYDLSAREGGAGGKVDQLW